MGQLEEGYPWNKKNKNSIKTDKQYATIINEFKRGRIDHPEYVRKIVKCYKHHRDLPKTRRALMRALEADSDSDS